MDCDSFPYQSAADVDAPLDPSSEILSDPNISNPQTPPANTISGGGLSVATASSESQQFPFLQLEKELQGLIIKYALIRQDRPIFPYFRRGMLHKGPYTSSYNDEGLVDNENIDLALLRISKDMHDMCVECFYGQNDFIIAKAEVAKWWFKHIGDQNLSYIRRMQLCIGTGYTRIEHLSPRPMTALAQEEEWLQMLHYLENRHRFDTLFILFCGWEEVNEDISIPEEDKAIIERSREGIHDLLWRYRGIRRAVVQGDERSMYLSDTVMDALEIKMKQPRDPNRKIQQLKSKNMSLTAVMKKLEQARITNATYEKMEEQRKAAEEQRKRAAEQLRTLASMQDLLRNNRSHY